MAADPGAAAHGEPYQGLRPYQEQDKGKFFGRDADCQILIDKILANKLTLLFAASGVGKSSLLQAAVLPRLKDPRQENLDAVYYFDWVSPPLGGLKQAVLDYLKDQNRLEADTPLQDLEQSTLKEFFDFCTLFTRHPLVIILDQFEEFFRYQRYAADFKAFIQQLATVITDKGIAVAVVISMREDFALELNAFKPQLPTLLFENFYRLERLTKENARIAIEIPVKRLGFRYEKPLLTELLNDLAVREVSQYSANPIGEFIDAVEPAYLQIICSQLWELDRRDRDKTLRYETYQSKGRAKGLVQNYVSDVLNRCSTNEKKLASLAFDHLITRRGAKMAFTVDDLAHLIDTDPQKLGQVLEKLEKNRILRGQSRQGVQWYELYHDLFSEPIERWNDAFKAAERNRRAINWTIVTALAGLALYVMIDIGINYFSYQLRLSVKREISDAIELYRGKPGSMDVLGLQRYIAETGYHRVQIEPDKLFKEKPIADFKT